MLAEQGKQDASSRSDVDFDLFIMTMVQNFSIFTFKSSLTKHALIFRRYFLRTSSYSMMKDVFLRYIKR